VLDVKRVRAAALVNRVFLGHRGRYALEFIFSGSLHA
jgi:hypothetical protein